MGALAVIALALLTVAAGLVLMGRFAKLVYADGR